VHRAPAAAEVVPTTVEQLLTAARATLLRLTPVDAHAAMREGALLVDIRSYAQRAADGTVPDAAFVSRNVLEWRLDPVCPHRDERLAEGNRLLALSCNEGYR
jgi:hypothetical protein